MALDVRMEVFTNAERAKSWRLDPPSAHPGWRLLEVLLSRGGALAALAETSRHGGRRGVAGMPVREREEWGEGRGRDPFLRPFKEVRVRDRVLKVPHVPVELGWALAHQRPSSAGHNEEGGVSQVSSAKMSASAMFLGIVVWPWRYT